MNLKEVTCSLRRLALAGLTAMLLVLPSPAGDGGDGGWINLPGSVNRGGGSSQQSGSQAIQGPTSAWLVVTGEAARLVLRGRPGYAAAIEPDFQVALRAAALLNGDQAYVEVGQRFVGGLGVMQVVGLPPVPFELTGERIDLAISAFQTLAAAGHRQVTLRLLAPTLDRLVVMEFDLTHLTDIAEPMLNVRGELR